MDAKTDDSERTQLALQSVEAMLDELPTLADDWDTISRDEQLAWSLEWGNEMAKLRRLADGAATGRLNLLQRERFRILAERTVQSIALIEQLDLRMPAETVLAAGQVRVSP